MYDVCDTLCGAFSMFVCSAVYMVVGLVEDPRKRRQIHDNENIEPQPLCQTTAALLCTQAPARRATYTSVGVCTGMLVCPRSRHLAEIFLHLSGRHPPSAWLCTRGSANVSACPPPPHLATQISVPRLCSDNARDRARKDGRARETVCRCSNRQGGSHRNL